MANMVSHLNPNRYRWRQSFGCSKGQDRINESGFGLGKNGGMSEKGEAFRSFIHSFYISFVINHILLFWQN